MGFQFGVCFSLGEVFDIAVQFPDSLGSSSHNVGADSDSSRLARFVHSAAQVSLCAVTLYLLCIFWGEGMSVDVDVNHTIDFHVSGVRSSCSGEYDRFRPRIFREQNGQAILFAR